MEKALCSIEGCKNEIACRGMCDTHYTRFRRTGLKNIARPITKKGSGCLRPSGYVYIQKNKRRVAEHVLIMEKIVGVKLPIGAKVHHINEDRSDNRPENIYLCKDEAEHHLVHIKLNAVKNGYPQHYRKCGYCKKHDDPCNMKVTGNSYRHAACKREYDKQRMVANE